MTVLANRRRTAQARRAKEGPQTRSFAFGDPDNSPAIHRWAAGGKEQRSPVRDERTPSAWHGPSFAPPGLSICRPSTPTVETVGYGRSSRRDYPAWTGGTGPPVSTGGRKNGHAPAALLLVLCFRGIAGLQVHMRLLSAGRSACTALDAVGEDSFRCRPSRFPWGTDGPHRTTP